MTEVKFRHAPDMGEISGFGGSYEECCQDMLEAGVHWLVEQQLKRSVDIKNSELKDVYGLLFPESDDAKEIEKVVLAAAKGEASGAMHHAVMSRLGFISKRGWAAYCKELRRDKDARV